MRGSGRKIQFLVSSLAIHRALSTRWVEKIKRELVESPLSGDSFYKVVK